MNDWYTSKYGDEADDIEEEETPKDRRRRKRHQRSVREKLARRRRRQRKKERELADELALLEEEYGDILVDEEDEEDEELDEIDEEELEYQKRRRRIQRLVNRETLLDISSTLFAGRSKPVKHKRPMEARIADKMKSLMNGAYGVGLMVLTNDWLSKKDIE
jgi:hypothetical protein